MSTQEVEQLIKSLEDKQKTAISSFVDFMAKKFPDVTPRVSYAMPMWWAGGKMYNGYVGISPAKNHYSIHFHDENFFADLKSLLPQAKFGKRCINIKYGDNDTDRLVKTKVAEYFSKLL